MTSRSNHGRQAGFTLLEMMVVILVMGLALALITGYGRPHSQWLETQAAARDVAQAMRGARGQALVQGHPVALVLPRLPAGVPVSVLAPPGGIVFAPDGSASGGRVLLGGGGHQLAVDADWLTGGVRIDAP
jgi:general secretion pathway protein H